MIGRFSNTLLQPSKIQTHADELDGTKDRGNFRLATAQEVVSVLLKSSAPVNWLVSFLIPNPEDPNEATWLDFLWLDAAANNNIIDAVEMRFPVGTRVLVKTNNVVGSDPSAQIITRTLMERKG